jgi:hypothetical protein
MAAALSACGSSAPSGMAGMSSLPPPRYGHSLDVGLVSGTVFIRPPGGATFRLANTDRRIPIGSLIDTRRGMIDLRAAATSGAHAVKVQDGQFDGGRFTVRQRASVPVPEVRLAGGSRRSCAAAGTGPAGSSTVTTASRTLPLGLIRLLRAHGPGRFRTIGRSAAATVRGTVWLTADYCNGTLVKVTEGVVAVRNRATGATVTLRAGQSYFAATG